MQWVSNNITTMYSLARFWFYLIMGVWWWCKASRWDSYSSYKCLFYWGNKVLYLQHLEDLLVSFVFCRSSGCSIKIEFIFGYCGIFMRLCRSYFWPFPLVFQGSCLSESHGLGSLLYALGLETCKGIYPLFEWL